MNQKERVRKSGIIYFFGNLLISQLQWQKVFRKNVRDETNK